MEGRQKPLGRVAPLPAFAIITFPLGIDHISLAKKRRPIKGFTLFFRDEAIFLYADVLSSEK